MPRYFAKDLPNSPVWIHGHPVRFDFLSTEDGAIIAELDNCIRRQCGGIRAISPEEYEAEIKKKQSATPPVNSSKPPHSRQELSALHLPLSAVAGGNFARPQQPPIRGPSPHPAAQMRPMPDPIEVPNRDSFTVRPPTTVKMSEVMR